MYCCSTRSDVYAVHVDDAFHPEIAPSCLRARQRTLESFRHGCFQLCEREAATLCIVSKLAALEIKMAKRPLPGTAESCSVDSLR